MERSYKFAILQATPDERRGERVNVGIVVAGPGGLDVRLTEARKLRHLTGHHWELVADAYTDQIKAAWADAGDLGRVAETPGGASQVFSLEMGGTLRVFGDEYEERIASILKTLVNKPVLTRAEKQERINTEITKVLRNRGVLGQRDDDLDSYRVIPKYVVSREKAIVADFARRGESTIRVVSTLDLRGGRATHARACEKGAVLYFARERFKDEAMPLGVYAASKTEVDAHKDAIDILSSFAEGNVFNWLDAAERQRFQHALY